MKPVSEWDEAYIMSLPVGEFDWLETKGCRSLDLTIPNVMESAVLETISKEVSAFANSGGGTLIYGLTDPKAGDTEWHVDDGGVDVMVKKSGTKEWLETVIPHQMEPALEKFNIYAIGPSGPDSKIGQGRSLFVVEIPDSEQAPHQAKDYKYYARVASRAQPIRHRQVVDIMNRRQHPVLDLRFKLKLRGMKTQASGQKQPTQSSNTFIEMVLGAMPEERLFSDIPALEIAVFNNGRVFAEYVNLTVFVPVELTPEEVVFSRIMFRHQSDIRNLNGRDYHRYIISNNFGGSPSPILPSLGIKYYLPLRPSVFVDDTPSVNDSIFWWVQADNSPVTSGWIALNDIEVND